LLSASIKRASRSWSRLRRRSRDRNSPFLAAGRSRIAVVPRSLAEMLRMRDRAWAGFLGSGLDGMSLSTGGCQSLFAMHCQHDVKKDCGVILKSCAKPRVSNVLHIKNARLAKYNYLHLRDSTLLEAITQCPSFVERGMDMDMDGPKQHRAQRGMWIEQLTEDPSLRRTTQSRDARRELGSACLTKRAAVTERSNGMLNADKTVDLKTKMRYVQMNRVAGSRGFAGRNLLPGFEVVGLRRGFDEREEREGAAGWTLGGQRPLPLERLMATERRARVVPWPVRVIRADVRVPFLTRCFQRLLDAPRRGDTRPSETPP